jgi:nucleotide-binding universal stress UspA family protein
MFERLLIPVDGSAPAKRAAKYGLELAAIYDAAVDVLHVTDNEERGNEILDKATAFEVADELSVERHLIEGKPSKSIVHHAEAADADLVVMGRYGRSGITQHLLGSTSERVLRNTEVPVLTVPGDGVDERTGREYSDVLLTTDGSETAEKAGPYAADIARRTAATLHLLTVVDVQAQAGPFDAGGVDKEYMNRLRNRGQDALDSVEAGLDSSALDVQSSMAEGDTIEEIVSYATDHEVDLVAISSEGQNNVVGQRLGSVAGRVLKKVQRPVLVVPTPK